MPLADAKSTLAIVKNYDEEGEEDGWKVGWSDGRTVGRTGQGLDGQYRRTDTERRTDADGLANEYMDRKGWTDGLSRRNLEG